MENNNFIPDYLNAISINPKKQFEILDFIGEGTFGQVYKARHKKTNKIYSVKIIKSEKISAIEKILLIWAYYTMILHNIQVLYY